MGVPSARRLEKATWDDVATRWLAADQHPPFTTLNRFRLRNLQFIDDLFLQVLKLCQEAGLVRLGRVALDGTKIKANASKHRSRTYERIKADEEALRRQVRRILRKAERVDQEEGELYGKDKNPYLPPLRPDWKERLKRLREARKAVEEREKKKGKNEPDPKTQYNFTDPDSRIMQESANKGAYIQGYNAQAAVDAKSQVIVSRFSRRRTRTTSTWPR